MAKSIVKGVRFDEATARRLQTFEDETYIEDATLIRAATDAALKFYQENGYLRFPLAICPEEMLPKKPRKRDKPGPKGGGDGGGAESA
jgi:hypothetical protein